MLDDNLSEDEIHRLLSSQTRREAIRYFEQSSKVSHSYEEVAEHLHDRTEERLEDLKKRLHHIDLPNLDNADVLLYDMEENEITYLGNERLEESIKMLD